jgi:hypothetical protein
LPWTKQGGLVKRELRFLILIALPILGLKQNKTDISTFVSRLWQGVAAERFLQARATTFTPVASILRAMSEEAGSVSELLATAPKLWANPIFEMSLVLAHLIIADVGAVVSP